MDKSKKFLIIFTILIIAFTIGRFVGNSNYRELKDDYKELETAYSTTSFNMQGYFKLSEEQRKELNRGFYSFPQGTYLVGASEEIIPGVYEIVALESTITTVKVNGETYNLCGDASQGNCQQSYENIELSEGSTVIIEGPKVQFEMQ